MVFGCHVVGQGITKYVFFRICCIDVFCFFPYNYAQLGFKGRIPDRRGYDNLLPIPGKTGRRL
jgi:hypothetical protein